MAMLFISHDLGVIARICERVVVMYAGQVVGGRPVATCSRSRATPTRRSSGVDPEHRAAPETACRRSKGTPPDPGP